MSVEIDQIQTRRVLLELMNKFAKKGDKLSWHWSSLGGKFGGLTEEQRDHLYKGVEGEGYLGVWRGLRMVLRLLSITEDGADHELDWVGTGKVEDAGSDEFGDWFRKDYQDWDIERARFYNKVAEEVKP